MHERLRPGVILAALVLPGVFVAPLRADGEKVLAMGPVLIVSLIEFVVLATSGRASRVS